MMKTLSTLLIFSLALALSGQVANKTVTDCNNSSRDIYGTLATGKALMIASEGFDCSICMGKAPGLQSWAAQNKNKVEVWGAMTFLYPGGTPTCADASSWVSSYSWTDIFTFLDNTRFWFNGGTPRYIVYSPADSIIAYEGSNEAQARNTALSLSTSTIGAAEYLVKEFTTSGGEGFITLNNLPQNFTTVQVVAITGKVVKTLSLTSPAASERIDLRNYTAGIYLVNVQNKNGFQAVRKVYLR